MAGLIDNENEIYLPVDPPDTDDPVILKRYIIEELQKISRTVISLEARISALEP